MVASDTVVGIVGAVLLVAVMAGVFVYEYNNTPEADEDGALRDAFAARFAGLDADEDIDGDGRKNYLDDDLDGDKVQNADDADVGYSQVLSATIPPASTNPIEIPVFVGTGNVHLQASVTYTSATPNPLPPSPSLQMQLLDASGAEVAAAGATGAAGTSAYTMSFEVAEQLPAGQYTLRLNIQQTGPAATSTTATGSLEAHYTN